MITVVTKANKGLYNQLFQDVEKWLRTHNGEGQPIDGENVTDREPLLGLTQAIDPETNEKVFDENNQPVMVPDSITSLGELFTFMRFITKYAPIYTRLPLDEEPFFIDANSRSITVPKDFVANGVSVQGDEIAEILFFKINRFFDATDLSQCDIYVQWKSSELDEDGKPMEGVSRTWVQDVDSEPGYLIFGWPLSSAITKAAGNVTFSVRFYRLGTGDELIYSFSTLDQTVKIQPALDYDIEEIGTETNKYVVDDQAANIRERAINSPASGAEAPLLPYWEENKLELFKSDLVVLKDLDGPNDESNIRYYIMNLDTDENGFSVVPLVFHMDALSEDEGIVSYTWSKVGKNGSINNEDDPFYLAINYIETDDTDAYRALYPNKTYYYKAEQDTTYQIVRDSQTLEELRNEDKIIYELVSTVTIASVGRYTPFAQNRVGKFFSKAISTVPVYVPYPVAPELGELTADEEPILRTVVNGDEEEFVPIELSCDVDLADEYGNDVSETGGKATFVWKRCALDGVDYEVLDGMVSDKLVLSAADEDAEGYYQVTVTNNLNGETAQEDSSILRVTKPARKVKITIDAAADISVAAARARTGNLAVHFTDAEPDECRVDDEDYFSYQWYRYIEGGSNAQADRDAANEGMYADATGGVNNDLPIDDTFTDDQLSVASATTPNFLPPDHVEATYFCVITNHYNGTEKSVASPFYHVTL